MHWHFARDVSFITFHEVFIESTLFEFIFVYLQEQRVGYHLFQTDVVGEKDLEGPEYAILSSAIIMIMCCVTCY